MSVSHRPTAAWTLTIVDKVLERDIVDISTTTTRNRLSVVGSTKDLDTGAVLGVAHRDVPDVNIGNDVGCIKG